MSRSEHIARHQQLHRSLDELIADYLLHNRGRVPSNTTVLDLMSWSHQQTIEPQTAPTGRVGDLLENFARCGLEAQQAIDELLR